MNEVRALVEAFDAATRRGERCALATVVSVEGSSYRRPGARMLVCEGGTSTGTISAGCLEADVVEHAKRVIRGGDEAVLVEYDTASTGEEMAWGLGLGCNGVVRVLVEPVAPGSLYVEALRRSCEGQTDAAPIQVATVYGHTPSSPSAARIETGARLFIEEGGEVGREKLSGEAAAMLEGEVRALSFGGVMSGAHIFDVDGAGVKVFVETLLPPVPLVIFGAGHDALPIVELARGLGWYTEVVDPQTRPASLSRFAAADRVTLARPEEVSAEVSISSRTLALLMSHNYSHDLVLLKFLLASPARYIGVMGPRKRTERMLNDLAAADEAFRLGEEDRERLYSPAGLDIGANSPAEIALSIVAEMRAVLDGRRGGTLRERRGSIHGSPTDGEGVTLTEEFARPVVAA
ncbi:MAG TPA: XdhC/CoxI family protein [Pyrinomonadaceae bacterium]|nr:XdhC/CoxI family protein [Pyrinomonadaceae bacterium]